MELVHLGTLSLCQLHVTLCSSDILHIIMIYTVSIAVLHSLFIAHIYMETINKSPQGIFENVDIVLSQVEMKAVLGNSD